MTLPAIVVFVLALTGLIYSGRMLIRTLTRIATAFGVSQFAIAFVLLAVATSLPELSVAISSARLNAGDLILSVVLGSNLINSTLILGLAAFMSLGISTRQLNFRRDLVLGTAIAVVPLLLLSDLTITSAEGGVLLAAFCYYVWLMYHSQITNNDQFRWPHVSEGLTNLGLTLFFIVLLMASADLTVSSARDIAHTLGIPSFIIGIFLIAFGTSLPELVTAVHAARSRNPEISLGNIIGSNIANSSLILGLAAIINPIQVNPTPAFYATATIMAFSALLVTIYGTFGRITTREGAILVGLFVLFGFLISYLSF